MMCETVRMGNLSVLSGCAFRVEMGNLCSAELTARSYADMRKAPVRNARALPLMLVFRLCLQSCRFRLCLKCG